MVLLLRVTHCDASFEVVLLPCCIAEVVSSYTETMISRTGHTNIYCSECDRTLVSGTSQRSGTSIGDLTFVYILYNGIAYPLRAMSELCYSSALQLYPWRLHLRSDLSFRAWLSESLYLLLRQSKEQFLLPTTDQNYRACLLPITVLP